MLFFGNMQLFTKVPFKALRNRRTGKYLIQNHTISQTPSLRVLRACTERLQELQSAPLDTDRPGSVIALGNPAYDCSKCKSVNRQPLPGTGDEVDFIAKMFGTEAQVVTLKEKKATVKELMHWAALPSEAGFRQPILHIGAHNHFDKDDHRKNVLHLACDPGVGSTNSVSLSSSDGASTLGGSRGQPDDFVLSDEDVSDKDVRNSDDEADTPIKRNLPMSNRICIDSMIDSEVPLNGIGSRVRGVDSNDNSHGLTAEFMSSLDPKLKAELVVLSGCHTSRGRVTTEGVLSMARSFMIAGVPCVVASLWKVDDTATKALMERFYEALRRNASVPEALRSAILHSVRTHPQKVGEWAAFNVWGDPSLCIPSALQLQGQEAGSPTFDASPQTLQMDSLSRTPMPEPVYYNERYGHRDAKPYDFIFYDPSTITSSKFELETNAMYKWSWFKDFEIKSSLS